MRIAKFIGPSILAPRLTNDGVASRAWNARLTDGTLRAMRVPLEIGTCDGRPSALLPNAPCLPHGYTPIGLVPDGSSGIVVRDGALYYHESGLPVMIPRPPAPVVVGGLSTTQEVGRLMSFRVTRVGPDGNESLPSEPSPPVYIDPAKTVRLSTSGYVRVYAAHATSLDGELAPGQVQADWLLVGEFASAVSFAVKPETWPLVADGELPDEWCQPEGLLGVARLDSGHFVVWSDSALYISERHLEYAFPIRGQVAIESTPVSVVPIQNAPAATVITRDQTFLLSVAQQENGPPTPTLTPYTMTHGLYGGPETIGRTPLGVVYPSRMGLISVTGDPQVGYQLLTRNAIQPEQWETERPNAGTWHNGMYVSDKWVLDVSDQQHGANELAPLMPHTFGGEDFVSTAGGRLLFRRNGVWYAWGEGDGYAAAEFESRTYVAKGPIVLTCVKVAGRNIGGVEVALVDEAGDVLWRTVLSDSDENRPINFRPVRLRAARIRLRLPASDREISIWDVHFAGNRYALSRTQ